MATVTAHPVTPNGKHPVDEVPPITRLIPLAIQHVLAMYAGAVAVPLVVGGAMISAGKMAPSDLPYLITADLLVAGIGAILQTMGFWKFGARLPIMQGCTFAAVSPMIIIGGQYGPAAIYGAVISCGVFMMLLAPVFARLLFLFPPLVTGTVILCVGLSLMPVAATNISGGSGAKDLGSVTNVCLGLGTLAIVLLVERFAPPAIARTSVLCGMIIGTIIAACMGKVDFSAVASERWIGIATPFHFGTPDFKISAIISMLLVALVIMTETTGDFLACGQIVGKPASKKTIADGLRADGAATILGGVFNTFPYTAFAQNIGLLEMSRVRSRFVVTGAGAVLVILGLIPKLGGVVAAIPASVLGGATAALFGMIAASGIRTLSQVKLDNRAILVIAVSITFGMLPVMDDGIFAKFPTWFSTVFDSGITCGAFAAILLNALFFGKDLFNQDNGLPEVHTVESTAGAEALGEPATNGALAESATTETGAKAANSGAH